MDELGCTPLDQLLADAFYRFIAIRYEGGSVIVTSNKSFENWVEVFPDAVIASAILDRLVHHATIIEVTSDSYRRKEALDRVAAEAATTSATTITPPPATTTPSATTTTPPVATALPSAPPNTPATATISNF